MSDGKTRQPSLRYPRVTSPSGYSLVCQRCGWSQLTLAELQSVDKTFSKDALAVFDLKKAMAQRNLTGAPGTKEVAKQLARWREQLS